MAMNSQNHKDRLVDRLMRILLSDINSRMAHHWCTIKNLLEPVALDTHHPGVRYFADAYHNMANILLITDKPEDARACYSKALEHEPINHFTQQ